ncbi:MAG TPA: hypothetical protein VL651_01060 [Bacteroidia bacterium]|jgi:hypothetical protein|nr:hypothetical protein [Bacteroidia bacterium]
MPSFKLLVGEKLIVNDPHVSWRKGGLSAVNGQLKLTDRRIVFIRDAHPFAIFFLYLIPSMRSAMELEYDLKKIKKVSVVEYGKEKRLTIDPGNERPKEFETMKAMTFESEINKLILNS